MNRINKVSICRKLELVGSVVNQILYSTFQSFWKALFFPILVIVTANLNRKWNLCALVIGSYDEKSQCVLKAQSGNHWVAPGRGNSCWENWAGSVILWIIPSIMTEGETVLAVDLFLILLD